MEIVKISDDQNEITLDDGRVLVAKDGDCHSCDLFFDHEYCLIPCTPCCSDERKDCYNKIFVERKEERVTIAKSEYDRLVKTRLDAMHFFGAWQVASSISDKDSMIRVAQQFINKLEEK